MTQNDINNYNKFLTNKIIVYGIIFGIIIIGLIITLIVYFRKKYGMFEKITISVLIIFTIIVAIWILMPYILDVTTDAYIAYHGNYTVETVLAGKGVTGRTFIKFPDEEEIIYFDLSKGIKSMEIGDFEGRIVYSKHTRYIFKWENE